MRSRSADRTLVHLIVRCPHCSSRYRLSEALLGRGGSRVRCPRCGERFDVPGPGDWPLSTVPGEENAPIRATIGTEPGCSGAPDATDVRTSGVPSGAPAIAGQVLDALAPHVPALIEANARGRLFSECGSVLFQAFDEYRRRAGPEASVGVFRDALRERWMIELV